ncbi:MAG TPA: FliM/FliN family flagellar motor switch protein [Candidatus Nitrosotalea sp.]|nr:FliM/FliN family flagellar motor switch protein [Candidatus Nitrosotalea sp.]
MTETPNVPLIVQFCRAWTESFTHVLGQLGVASPKVTAADPAPAKALSAEELAVTISVFFKGGGVLKGDQVWVAEKPAALQCAQLLMSEPLDPAAELSETHRDAFAELLRQVAGQTATTWKQIAGGETDIAFQAASDAVFVPAQSTTVQVSGEKFPELALRFFVNSALFDALSVAPPEPAAPPESQSQEVPDHAHPSLVGAVPVNLELLLDVELEATIRFGEREMLLRDVLGLMPGAVIELNQMVNEPASLLVAGRMVARGEVVVVDGNFGLRVTEVASRGQRAELLHANVA